MNPIKFTFFLLFAAPLLTGCTLILGRNLSKIEPYSQYTGKVVPLVEPMVVVESYGGYYPLTPYHLTQPRHVGSSPVIKRLNAQDKIRIDSVHWVNGIDNAYVIAVGSTVEQGSTEGIRFKYMWGGFDYIKRAPWEHPDTPESRFVGWGGNKYTNEQSEQGGGGNRR